MDIATSKNGVRGLRVFFALVVLCLYAPLVLLVVFSFNDNNIPTFPLKGFTTNAYEQFASNPALKSSLLTSAKVAALASLFTVALGVLASIALVRRRFFGKSAASALLLSPLVIPYIVFAVALLILFNLVGFPELGITTLVIGHTVVFLPYAILVLAPRLERIDVRLEEAAQDLGASGLRTFWWVTLPLILPAIISSFLVTFVFSFDEIVLSSFVAGNAVTFPLYLYSQLRFPVLLPQLLAVAVIVMTVSFLIVVVTEVGRRRVERRLGAELEGAEVLGARPPRPAEAAGF